MRKYKRLFAASTVLLVMLGLATFGFILSDEPEPVFIGVGKAGVDTTTVPDTIAVPEEVVSREIPDGAASYYGDELAGRPTASGETFDPQRLTAAHRTLPMGTRLRVTNTRNDESVIVRVNDRGPFSGNRVLDLSYAAAKKIGMLQRGEARVRMEVLE